jgi:hypothetical protein
MGIFTQYDSTSPDLVDEVALAAKNPLEIGRQYKQLVVGATTITDPQWEMSGIDSLLDTMVSTDDFGTQYDFLPDKMSSELYDTHELWAILMRINGARTRADFRGPKLKYVTSGYTGQLLAMLAMGQKRAAAADKKGIPTLEDLTVRKVFA